MGRLPGLHAEEGLEGRRAREESKKRIALPKRELPSNQLVAQQPIILVHIRTLGRQEKNQNDAGGPDVDLG